MSSNSKTKIQNIFDTIAKNYNSKIATFPLSKLRQYEINKINQIFNEIRTFVSCLEVGCGSGFYTNFLTKKTKDVTCMDISQQMLLQIQIDDIIKIHGDFLEYNSERTYDFIFSFGVSEFVKSHDLFIEKISKTLNKTGSAAITFIRPNLVSFIYYFYYLSKGIHLNISTSQKIEKYCKINNLQIKKNYNILPFNKLYIFEKL